MTLPLPALLLLLLAAFLVGWFSRVFMEKHRAAQLAKIDAQADRAGDYANAVARRAQEKVNEFRAKQ